MECITQLGDLVQVYERVQGMKRVLAAPNTAEGSAEQQGVPDPTHPERAATSAADRASGAARTRRPAGGRGTDWGVSPITPSLPTSPAAPHPLESVWPARSGVAEPAAAPAAVPRVHVWRFGSPQTYEARFRGFTGGVAFATSTTGGMAVHGDSDSGAAAPPPPPAYGSAEAQHLAPGTSTLAESSGGSPGASPAPTTSGAPWAAASATATMDARTCALPGWYAYPQMTPMTARIRQLSQVAADVDSEFACVALAANERRLEMQRAREQHPGMPEHRPQPAFAAAAGLSAAPVGTSSPTAGHVTAASLVGSRMEAATSTMHPPSWTDHHPRNVSTGGTKRQLLFGETNRAAVVTAERSHVTAWHTMAAATVADDARQAFSSVPPTTRLSSPGASHGLRDPCDRSPAAYPLEGVYRGYSLADDGDSARENGMQIHLDRDQREPGDPTAAGATALRSYPTVLARQRATATGLASLAPDAIDEPYESYAVDVLDDDMLPLADCIQLPSVKARRRLEKRRERAHRHVVFDGAAVALDFTHGDEDENDGADDSAAPSPPSDTLQAAAMYAGAVPVTELYGRVFTMDGEGAREAPGSKRSVGRAARGLPPSPREPDGWASRLDAMPAVTPVTAARPSSPSLPGTRASTRKTAATATPVAADISRLSDSCLLDAATAAALESASRRLRMPKSQNVGGGTSRRCRCKRSRCLKLYCDCFAAGVMCTAECACNGCCNHAAHAVEIQAARTAVLERNPQAFQRHATYEHVGGEGGAQPRGCHCKRSDCLKKYCECFKAGRECTEHCACEGCKNCDGVSEPLLADIRRMNERAASTHPSASLSR